MNSFKIKLGLSIVLLLGLLTLVYYLNKYSFANEKEYFSSNTKPEKGLQIGIIGDSWVVRKDLNVLLQEKLLDKGVKSEIYFSGNPGAKTKKIYENLFKDEDEEFSSKKVIEKKPDYCIVIAGVNDAATQIGPEFYSHHMLVIIKTLLHYNIKPIVVSLPEFGIEENFENKNIISSLSNRSTELFMNGGTSFKISDYRKLLLEDLQKANLDKKVSILNFDEVAPDYNKDKVLYSDPLHLNEKGYENFSEFLARGIINLESIK